MANEAVHERQIDIETDKKGIKFHGNISFAVLSTAIAACAGLFSSQKNALDVRTEAIKEALVATSTKVEKIETRVEDHEKAQSQWTKDLQDQLNRRFDTLGKGQERIESMLTDLTKMYLGVPK